MLWQEPLNRLAWLLDRENPMTRWESTYILRMAELYNGNLKASPTDLQQRKIIEIHDKYSGRIEELTRKP